MRRWQRLATVLVLVGVSAWLFATPAQAVHVGCGDIITEDTTLDSDLLNCASDGIVIGAPGITLDLGGHLIDGPAPRTVSGFVNRPAGVLNLGRYDGLTVQNGRIAEFATGVIASSEFGLHDPTTGLVIRRLELSSNLGLAADRATEVLIEGNTIRSRERSLLLTNSSFATIRHNDIDSVPPLRSGAGMQTSSFGDRSHHNVMERNKLAHGILALFGHDDLASRNVLGVDGHMIINGTNQTVSRNDILPGGDGISLAGSGRVYKNDLRGVRSGIRVNFGESLVDHNVVTGSAGDGITANWAGSVVAHNKAKQNEGLGIFAAPGVIDGGGNKASGNGNPAQCVGVSCK